MNTKLFSAALVDRMALPAAPLSDGNSDASQLYSLNGFAGVSGVPLGDVHLRTDIPVVATDATIAINFTNPVSNDMGVAPGTYGATGDAGLQIVRDLSVRYGLKSIAVRRSPRFGAGAGTWTDLVAAVDTELDLSGTVHLAPALAFRWDADSRSDGLLSPRRLLVNSSTPYTFTTGGGQNDEEALRHDIGFPCCNSPVLYKELYPRPHFLTFVNTQVGIRVTQRQQFSAQGVWWQWTTSPMPLAVAYTSTTAGTSIAAVLHPASASILGVADFPEPVIQADCSLSFTLAPTTVYFEGYAGLKLVSQQQASVSSGGTAGLHMTATRDQPITRVILRVDALPAGVPGYALRIESVSYTTANQMALFQGQMSRCESISKIGGKLSFLPNYDYEIAVVTEVKVASQSQGQRSSSLSEFVYFRTKGLPGLNSVKNTGAEIEPYIESLYPPAKAQLLYRAEPVVVSFTDGISTILPVDRVSAPGDPAEKTQAMELILNIDRVGSTKGLSRLTVPSGDWIDAHRATPPPPKLFPRAVMSGVDVRAGVRKAASFDPGIVRFLAVQTASPVCTVNALQSSQVLIHEPVGEDNANGPWQPSTTLRATVRQKDGPYTQRTSFDLMDSGAFVSQAGGAAIAAGAWSVNGSGSLVAPEAGAGRQYASLGDLGWNHLQVNVQFDPQGVAAGIAVGVANGTPVPQALIATVEPAAAGTSLVLRALLGGVETVLGAAVIMPATPLVLTIIAFDDTVRAQVGDVVVEAPRGPIREGRVALVAAGPAIFSGLSVDGLDLYRFDFATSRYVSFQEHIQSWNGALVAMQEGEAGASSTSIASLLSTDAAAIGGLMQITADPQARQALFTRWVTALALPLRQSPNALCISRLTDGAGSHAFLIESPEPISFTQNVVVSLAQIAAWQPVGTPAVLDALAALQFDGSLVSVALKFLPALHSGDAIVTVAKAEAGTTYSVYSLPQNMLMRVNPGHLEQTIGPGSEKNPIAVSLKDLPDGAIALLAGIRVVGAVDRAGAAGTTNQVSIPLVVLDNGPETTALLIPSSASGAAAPLAPGKYTLQFTIDRKRWRDTGTPDPESEYQQQKTVNLAW